MHFSEEKNVFHQNLIVDNDVYLMKRASNFRITWQVLWKWGCRCLLLS